MNSTWTKAKNVIAKILAPLSTSKRRKDPWLDAHAHQREVNRNAARRPHPHQDLLDAIDDAHRGGPRWIPRRRGWLDR